MPRRAFFTKLLSATRFIGKLKNFLGTTKAIEELEQEKRSFNKGIENEVLFVIGGRKNCVKVDENLSI